MNFWNSVHVCGLKLEFFTGFVWNGAVVSSPVGALLSHIGTCLRTESRNAMQLQRSAKLHFGEMQINQID